MKKFLFLLIFSVIARLLSAQENKPDKHIKFYGFVRNTFYYDTYKGVDAAMDQFYLTPLYIGEDSNGKHLNEEGSAHMTAIATRLGANITGPEVFGAKTSANIETDFAGITGSEPVILRIRKAFVKFDWEKASFLMGQNWHPFWGGKHFPTVAPLNTGAPFQPFNRSPQVNIDYKIGKLTLSGTALYENQYVSKGFYDADDSNSKTLPKRNAAIPELVFSINYAGDNFFAGASAQYNTIKPIDKTSGTDSTFLTDELNTSAAAMAYIHYKNDKLSILAKAIYGQNLANLTMLGGYGVNSYNAATGAYTYTNYNHYTALFNAVYGKKFQVGLFAGIGSNLGTDDELVTVDDEAKTAGLLLKIQDMSRISTHIAYNVSKFKFMAEWERTSADYGTGSINLSDGLYETVETATNNRIIFIMMFFF